MFRSVSAFKYKIFWQLEIGCRGLTSMLSTNNMDFQLLRSINSLLPVMDRASCSGPLLVLWQTNSKIFHLYLAFLFDSDK